MDLNQIYAPINQLPPELLASIFLECLPGPGQFLERSNTAAPLQIVQTCRYWRSIGLTESRLWSSLRFSLYSSDVPDIKTWFLRSGNQSLSLEFAALFPPQRHLATSLAAHCERWKFIRLITSMIEVERYLSAVKDHLPLLYSLHIRCVQSFEGFHIGIFESAPELRILHMHGLRLNEMRAPWHQLTDFEMTYNSIDDCLDILEQTPRLIKCALLATEIGLAGGSRMKTPRRPVQLKYLKSLKLNLQSKNSDLYDHLRLPAISHISAITSSFEGTIQDITPQGISAFQSFLSLLSTSLRCLEAEFADGVIDEVDIIGFLQAAPFLTGLVMQRGWQVLTKRIFEELAEQSSDGLHYLAPQLQVIRLGGNERPFEPGALGFELDSQLWDCEYSKGVCITKRLASRA